MYQGIYASDIHKPSTPDTLVLPDLTPFFFSG